MFPEGRALEFLIVAIVALIVVGPKDLPVLLRKLGQFMAKVRSMAAEFRASFDEMARQSELDELRKEVEAMRKGQMADIASTIGGETTQAFDDISQGLSDVQLHPPMSYQYSQESDAPAKKTRARKASSGSKTDSATSSAKKASATKASVAKAAVTKTQATRKPAAPKSVTVAEAKPRSRKSAGTVS